MPLDLLSLYLQLPTFALVTARLAGFVMFQPLLGGEAFPAQIRALLILALGLVITPLVGPPGAPPENLASLLAGMAGELVLGALFALLMMLCFLGLQLGGNLIAQESGLAFGAVINPATAEEESVLSTFYVQVAMVVFLAAGGQRVIVATALDSFAAVPLLQCGDLLKHGAVLICDAVATGLSMGVRVAAPAVLAMFLTNTGLGIVSRTMPQFNVISLGFTAKSLIAFGIMAVTLPTALHLFSAGVDTIVGLVDEFLGTAAGRVLG